MPGTPSSLGCDGCRRQKKRVSYYPLIRNTMTDMKSATKLNQRVEDVDALEYHVLEMVSRDGNSILLFKTKTATNR
jgi:hypothetical protein